MSITGKSAIYASGVTQNDIIVQGQTDAIATSSVSEVKEDGDTVAIPQQVMEKQVYLKTLQEHQQFILLE